MGQRVHTRQSSEGGDRPQPAHHAAYVLAQPTDETEVVDLGDEEELDESLIDEDDE